MTLPRWIFGEDATGERQFIIHMQSPRFIGEIFNDPDAPAEAQDIRIVEWIDAPGVDALFLARLMREAGDALIEYDRLFDEEEASDQDE